MENKLEGFIQIPEGMKCNNPNCEKDAIISTIFEDKVKGLRVEKIHFWCKEHYDLLSMVGEEK